MLKMIISIFSRHLNFYKEALQPHSAVSAAGHTALEIDDVEAKSNGGKKKIFLSAGI